MLGKILDFWRKTFLAHKVAQKILGRAERGNRRRRLYSVVAIWVQETVGIKNLLHLLALQENQAQHSVMLLAKSSLELELEDNAIRLDDHARELTEVHVELETKHKEVATHQASLRQHTIEMERLRLESHGVEAWQHRFDVLQRHVDRLSHLQTHLAQKEKILEDQLMGAISI